MKHIVFLDFVDLLAIDASLDFLCDFYKDCIDKGSDEFTPELLAEFSDKISDLTRIHDLISGYIGKGIAFDESCIPDLESQLPALISGYLKGDLAFISLNEVGAADANDPEGGAADEK